MRSALAIRRRLRIEALEPRCLLDGTALWISEFMADNVSGLKDGDNNCSDWLEIYNPNASAVSLQGWALTDDASDMQKWPFPNVSMGAGAYRVFIASGESSLAYCDSKGYYHTNFKLSASGEYLALVRPDGTIAHEYAPVYPQQLANVSYGINTTSLPPTAGLYFTTATPGSANSAGRSNLGPWINDATNKVARPAGGAGSAPLTITALVTPSLRTVGTVQLAYRVMFGSETLSTMYDDGPAAGHGDAAAGDHFYTALLPTTSLQAGQMLRWRVIAKDTGNYQSTAPDYFDAANFDQYYGTVAQDGVQSALPVYRFFVNGYTFGAQTTVDSDAGARGDFFYNDELYDNVLIRIKGLTTKYLFKRSHHVDFNPTHRFHWADGEADLDSLALNAEYIDPSYARQYLSMWLHNAAGTGAPVDFPVRLQMNGGFWQLAFHTQPEGGDMLRQMGLDPDGALYKFVRMFTTDSSGEKQTRTWEDNSDYMALAAAIGESNTLEARRQALFDRLDLPQVINYLAVARLVEEADDVWANMAPYRDSNGTGRWRLIPYDTNLSFGQQVYDLPNGKRGDKICATDDTDNAHPLYGGSTVVTWYMSAYWNRLYDAVIQVPETRAMLLRRIRTLADEFLGPPGTPYASRPIEQKLDELVARIAPEAELDRAKWGWPTPSDYGRYGLGNQPFSQGVSELKNLYLDPRRTHLYVTHSINNTGKAIGITNTSNAGIPAQQGTGLNVVFGAYEATPASGNPDQEWLTIVNRTNVAVDLSGWRLHGGIDYRFEPGTVLAPGGTLYVAANLIAFQARTASPKAGQGLFVQGDYSGHLSTWGETIELRDDQNNLVATLATPGEPSAEQQSLRITEVMYHPQDPPLGSIYTDDDFEFVELKNVGATSLSLTGVKFSDGVYFSFAGGAVTTLAPGAKVLVVANTAAFQSRYGHDFDSLIAGQFAPPPGEVSPSRLDNTGEKIVLADASGETILSFTYNDSWYTQADGAGNSLVIRDAGAANCDLWDQRQGWAASRQPGGSPGADDAAPEYAPDVIVISELLAHRTDERDALGDWVEFYNATNADIPVGGWYLSNDPQDLQKYHIAAGASIPALGYLAFNWRDHFGSTAHAGCTTPFTFGELGGAVYLTSATDGAPSGYQVSEEFAASDTGVTFGRLIKSTGGKDFVPTSAPTYESPNALPLVGPVVINEVSYYPDAAGDSFIELKNLTGVDVNLYDPARPQNTWRLTQGIDFTFPANARLSANSFALVVSIDPGRFRTKYNVPAAVPIYGPYRKRLNNDSDTIELQRPGNPQPDGAVPFYRVDQLTYSDDSPWPQAADGFGASLVRKSASTYGNDVVKWEAGHPTPGAANVVYDATPPSGPTVVAAGKAGTSVNFTWTGAGDPQSGVAYYRVYEGGNLVRMVSDTTLVETNFSDGIAYAEISAVNGHGVEGPRVVSSPAVRTVVLTSAAATGATSVKLTFSEPLSRDAAQDISHYQVAYGGNQQATITEAAVLPDGQSVQLKVSSSLAQGISYTATASGIIAQSGNAIAASMSSKSFTYTSPATVPVRVLREYWTGIAGGLVSDLTWNVNYPDSPLGTSDVTGGYFEAPTNWAANYGTRMRAYVTVPASGDYVFWIAADDSAELWLSTDDSPANRQKIAWVFSGTTSRQWTAAQEPNQKSAAIHLDAGHRYYIEALHKESVSSDNLAVGWQLPSGTLERPIPISRLTAYNPAAENTVAITATDPSASETGPDKGTFAITRTGSTATALSVYYTVTGTASTRDFQEDLTGTAVIPAGVSSVAIDVTPVLDRLIETDETVKLTLLADKKYTIGGTGSAVVTIASASAAPIYTRLVVSPATAFVPLSGTRQYTATALDQFGAPVTPQPSFTWAATAGTVTAGLFTAPDVEMPVTITVSGGGKDATASVAVTAASLPQIVSWKSAQDHANGYGDLSLTIPDESTFSEPRSGGIHRLLVTFDRPITAGSFTPSVVKLSGNDAFGLAIDLSAIVVTTGVRDGSVGVIDLSPALPDLGRYLVAIDSASFPLVGDSDRVLTALQGDVSGDLRVDVADLSALKAQYVRRLNTATVAQVRADFNMNGCVDGLDLSMIWRLRDRDARLIADPVMLPGPALGATALAEILTPSASEGIATALAKSTLTRSACEGITSAPCWPSTSVPFSTARGVTTATGLAEPAANPSAAFPAQVKVDLATLPSAVLAAVRALLPTSPAATTDHAAHGTRVPGGKGGRRLITKSVPDGHSATPSPADVACAWAIEELRGRRQLPKKSAAALSAVDQVFASLRSIPMAFPRMPWRTNPA